MLNQTLIGALVSIIPYWSSDLIRNLNIGNEYSMIFNIILGEIVKYISDFTSDIIIIGIFSLMIIIAFANKFNFGFNYSISKSKKMSLTNKYIYFEKINKYLMLKYDIKNKTFFENNKVIDSIQKILLEPNLYLSVEHKKNSNSNSNSNSKSSSESTELEYEIIYTFESDKIDLDKFLDKMIMAYPDYKYNLTLCGNEQNNICNYNYDLVCVVYTLINKFEITNTRVLSFKGENKDNSFNYNYSNNEKKRHETSKSEIIETNNESIKTLENCDNVWINKEIILSVSRKSDNFICKLFSNDYNLKNFIDECKQYYQQEINLKKKYFIKLKAKISTSYSEKTVILCPEDFKALHPRRFKMPILLNKLISGFVHFRNYVNFDLC